MRNSGERRQRRIARASSRAFVRIVSESLERRRLFSGRIGTSDALTVPVLNSLPNAPQTIYLLFDGTPAFNDWTTNGARYGVHGTGEGTPVPAFTIDADANNFSAEETSEIRQIWQWVAEKFSPFNVNVTTVDPLTRADSNEETCIIGGLSSDWLKNPDAGGVSAIGGFDDPALSNECFIFSADPKLEGSSASDRVHYIGESIAHEVGHSMGLVHERAPSVEYYKGDTVRAPIMGDSSNNNSAKGIWWKTNNWPGQNSTDGIDDELYEMTRPGFLSYRTDDYDSPGTLTLTGDGSYAPVYGVIGTYTDVDSFTFTAPSTSVTFKVANATYGGMLTPNVSIYDPNTNVTVTSTYTTTATSATVSTSSLVPGHNYRVIVKGSGQYGDMGQYSLNGSAAAFATLNAGRLNVSGLPGVNNVTLSVEYNGAGDPGLLLVSDSVNGGNPGTQTFPINSVTQVNVSFAGDNNTLYVNPLYPLYNNGPSGGPYVTFLGSGHDKLIVDAGDAATPNNTVTVYNTHHLLFVSTDVQMPFGGVSSVTIKGSINGLDTYDVQQWNNSVQLTLNGQYASTNHFEIGANDFDPSDSVITVTGGNGNDTVSVDASELGGPLTGSVTNTNFSLGNQGSVLDGLIVTYANVESIDITGTANPDSLKVYSLASTTTLSFHGGDGNDTLQLGYWPGSIDLDSIYGNTYFYGDGGNDTALLDDFYNAYARTYVVDHTHIGTTTGANLFNGGSVDTFIIDGGSAGSQYQIYQTQPNATLILNAGAGADSFLFGAGETWPVTVNGNGGTDTLTVDDRNGSPVPYRTDVTATTVTRYFTTLATNILTYNSIESASYYSSNTATTANIFSTSSDIAAGYQWTVVMGNGNDTVTVYPHDVTTGAATLLGGIGILGGAGTDHIYIDDLSTPVGVTYRFYNPYGNQTTDIASMGGALLGIAYDMEYVAVQGGAFNDTFQLDSFQTNQALTLDGYGGDDALNVTPTSKNIQGNITAIASLLFDGGAGNDTARLYNDATTTAWNYSDNGPGLFAVNGSYTFVLAGAGLELLYVSAGSAADTFTITGLGLGQTLEVDGKAGNDAYLIGSGNTRSIFGIVQIDGGTGDTFSVDDSSDITGRVVHVLQGQIGGVPTDTLFASSIAAIRFTGIASASTLKMGSGADIVSAAPNTSTPLTLTGGSPTTSPGDQLQLALSGVTNPVVGASTVSSNNRATLSFSGFESVTSDMVAPTVTSDTYAWNGTVPSIDFTFSEPINWSFAGTSVTLTNTTTGQTIAANSIAATYDATTRTVHFTFPTLANFSLPDGNYYVVLPAGVTDASGNPVATSTALDFFVLAGDANRDRKVNFDDLVILAQNYNKTGKTFSQGNFNYDGGGNVNFDDLVILAQRYNLTVPAAAPLVAYSATPKHRARSVPDVLA